MTDGSILVCYTICSLKCDLGQGLWGMWYYMCPSEGLMTEMKRHAYMIEPQ